MNHLVGSLLTLWAIAVGCILRPRAARCPQGFDLRTGVRADGRFECWPRPSGPLDFDGIWGKPERSVQPEGVIGARIYCTGGARPIVVDERTVGCQREGWP